MGFLSELSPILNLGFSALMNIYHSVNTDATKPHTLHFHSELQPQLVGRKLLQILINKGEVKRISHFTRLFY